MQSSAVEQSMVRTKHYFIFESPMQCTVGQFMIITNICIVINGQTLWFKNLNSCADLKQFHGEGSQRPIFFVTVIC